MKKLTIAHWTIIFASLMMLPVMLISNNIPETKLIKSTCFLGYIVFVLSSILVIVFFKKKSIEKKNI